MKERDGEMGNVDNLFQHRSLSERFINPGWKIRLAEMGVGLYLANTGSTEVAIVGTIIFLHGLAGPAVFSLFQGGGGKDS